MSTIRRFSLSDIEEFFTIAKNYVKQSSPDAPRKKRRYSLELEELMMRWRARKTVRELFPSLSPKDPKYWEQVRTNVIKLHK